MGAKETAAASQDVQDNADLQGVVDAINRVQAVIEFEVDGTIITANENFLATVGYSLDEITGKHHRMFCDPACAKSDDYHDFWMKLAMGEFSTGEFQRFGKGGEEVWINASYNPILGADGNPYKAGAQNWAMLASLIETCKLNAVDPHAWLTATLQAIVNGHKQSRIDELMPWNYHPTV